MAQFYKPKANKSKQLSSKMSLQVTALDHLGAGIAQHQGKVVFVPGALPTETVTVQLTEQKKSFAKAKLIKVEQPSAQRVKPACQHYNECGGCDLQHLTHDAQRQHKRDSLVSLMQKMSGVSQITAEMLKDDIASTALHYRRRARLATLFDKNRNRLQLGFRATSSNRIVPIQSCLVLAPNLSALIEPFSINLNQLKAKASLGHLELTQAQNAIFAVIRVTKVLPNSDIKWLTEFASKHDITLLLQNDDGQLTQLFPLLDVNDSQQVSLPSYPLAKGRINCQFTPGNFVQVNGDINQRMVEQAIEWLSPQTNERILDLFCGVGNFSLPLALKGAQVIGVEGVKEMVTQAKQNALDNQLNNIEFYHADLSANLAEKAWLGKIDKLLLDPARAGAFECLQWLDDLQPKKVVYVSCNPASLARDAKVLIEQGYRLVHLAAIDMFPQTHHIEAMALFER
ncbi:23S rRNA (uracil(1939)-C(5))-methyltransferase RlmD [Shewanella intestini]|uniref:23S rRNA (uracil(1939)-C(5))-methyltransferase RlmD n=1 Tax=Shewanella intestini TaxID=2017544 RepID=A0ABS5HXN7_9GAMM|nr:MULTISPECIES: 23S rRNA (uracil(1939)-C(5))-methyltransferase RlmD [Shewanella]MBR9726519.1 23S rRNA (uracil(1939)-C(5))-methyltransferase RlmD [Shewanella intestini]MRG34915.1 23S rRNA (uracil(1939)-C(5))-methyltransferase RlmD [Shewanella sp. XMDDZSB0408]